MFSLISLIAGMLLLSFVLISKNKKGIQTICLLLVLLVFCGAAKPNKNYLKIRDDQITTDKDGYVSIKGKTNPKAKLKIDGKKISTKKNGKFSFTYQLKKEKKKNVSVTSKYGNKKIKKQVKVDASKKYKKVLVKEEKKAKQKKQKKLAAEKKARELKEIQTALALAQKEPTKQNYDRAQKIVTNSKHAKKEDTESLKNIEAKVKEKELIRSIESSITTAENSLNKSDYNKALQEKQKLTHENDQFNQRLETINQHIQQIEADEKAAREQETAQVNETSEMVLVTPTGSKYHNHVCGRGTYTEATLDSAISRGLEPCSKCF